MGDTAHELAMIAGALGACCNEVRDRAAAGEHGIGDPRIAAINDNGGTQMRIETVVFIVRDTITVGIPR
jgi:hypothetical protein